jgi:hypothetical protein
MAAKQDGQEPGWTGHCRYFLGALTPHDSNAYDPPIRLLRCTAPGTVVFVLDGDTDGAGTRVSRAMVAGDEISTLAIKLVRSTGTSGTYEGYR